MHITEFRGFWGELDKEYCLYLEKPVQMTNKKTHRRARIECVPDCHYNVNFRVGAHLCVRPIVGVALQARVAPDADPYGSFELFCETNNGKSSSGDHLLANSQGAVAGVSLAELQDNSDSTASPCPTFWVVRGIYI